MRGKINTRVKSQFNYMETHVPSDERSQSNTNDPADIADNTVTTSQPTKSSKTTKRKTRSKSKKKQTKAASGVGYSVDPVPVIRALLQTVWMVAFLVTVYCIANVERTRT